MSWLKNRLPKKRWKRVCLYLLSVFLIAVAVDMLLVQYWRRITISPETTHITAPLNAQGLPDYYTWINNRYAEGVTADNNAASLLLQAMGTTDFPKDWQASALTILGGVATTLPARVESYDTWLQAQPGKPDAQPIEDEFEQARAAPWTSADHPQRLQWLAQQRAGLDLVYQATAKPRLYIPWVPPGNQPIATGDLPRILLPALSGIRRISNVLASDAMHAIGEHDFAAFQKDLAAQFRLARLVAQGPSLIEYLVAVALEEQAWQTAATATLQPGFLTADQARTLAQSFHDTPEFPTPVRTLDELERCLALDAFCYASLYGFTAMEARTAPAIGTTGEKTAGPSLDRLFVPFHYNQILRDYNHAVDQLIDCCRQPTYIGRQKALSALSAQYGNPSLLGAITNPSHLLMRIFLPSLERVPTLHQRSLTTRDLAQLALALRQYQLAHNSFPDTLDSLTPDLLPKIPADAFADAPYHYTRDKDGYLLYSVGPNQKDDHGLPRKEAKGPDYDLVLRAEK